MSLWRRKRREADLDEEVRSHLEMATGERVAFWRFFLRLLGFMASWLIRWRNAQEKSEFEWRWEHSVAMF